MNNKDKIYITIISLLIILSIAILFYSNNKISKVEYIKSTLDIENDSLRIEILKSDAIIKSNYYTLDSLIKSKTIIHNYYETNIQNLSDTNIVSDDSISSFIRSQIYK